MAITERMNRARWIQGTAALFFLALLCSCTSVTATNKQELVDLDSSENGFMILDPGLAEELEIMPRSFEQAGKGVVVAIIEFRTTQRESIELEARTFFKNSQGQTTQVSAWQRFLVKLHPVATYSVPTLAKPPFRCMTQIRYATKASTEPVSDVDLDPRSTVP